MNKNLTVLVIVGIAAFFFLQKHNTEGSLPNIDVEAVQASVAVATVVATLDFKPNLPDDLSNTGRNPTGNASNGDNTSANVPNFAPNELSGLGTGLTLPADERPLGRKIAWVYLPISEPSTSSDLFLRESSVLSLDVCFRFRKGVPSNIQSFVAPNTYPIIHWSNSKGAGEFWEGWSPGDARELRSKMFEDETSQTLNSVQSSSLLTYNTARPWRYWTFPGSNRNDLIRHLSNDPNHAGKFSRSWLESQSFDVLNNLHSNDHNNTPTVRTKSVQPPQTTTRFRLFSAPKLFCPRGGCP